MYSSSERNPQDYRLNIHQFPVSALDTAGISARTFRHPHHWSLPMESIQASRFCQVQESLLAVSSPGTFQEFFHEADCPSPLPGRHPGGIWKPFEVLRLNIPGVVENTFEKTVCEGRQTPPEDEEKFLPRNARAQKCAWRAAV